MLFSNLFSCGKNWRSIKDALGPSVFELKPQARFGTAGSAALTMLYVSWRREIKWVWEMGGRGLNGAEKRESGSHPQPQRRNWPGQNWCKRVRRGAKASRWRKASRRKSRGVRKGSTATEPKILQVWMSTSGAQEASPLRDQIKITQRSYSSHITGKPSSLTVIAWNWEES